MICGSRFQVSWFMLCGLGRCRHSLDLRRPFESRLERLELRVRVEVSINVVVCGFFRVWGWVCSVISFDAFEVWAARSELPAVSVPS